MWLMVSLARSDSGRLLQEVLLLAEGLGGLHSLKEVVLLRRHIDGEDQQDFGLVEVSLRALSHTRINYSRVVIEDLLGDVRLLQ